MSEDPNGWERHYEEGGAGALRRAAGGQPPWKHRKASRELPPVVDHRSAHRRASSIEDAAERPAAEDDRP
jgi:hypothetical protein